MSEITRRSAFALGIAWPQFLSAGDGAKLMRELKPTASWPRVKMRTPRWTNGVLMSVQRHDTVDPLIWIVDGSGRSGHRTIPFRISGASSLRIEGFDRNQTGTIGLSGSAADSEGRVSGFVAFINPNGDCRIVQTSLYRPVRLAVGPDGTMWTAGAEVAISSSGKPLTGLVANASVIRRFDKDGDSIGSYVPQSTVGDAGHLSSSRHAITSSANRIAWYSVGGRFVEISADGELISDKIVPPPVDEESLLLSGFGLTNRGEVYIATNRAKIGTGSEPEAVDEKFRLNRTTNSWETVLLSAVKNGDIETGTLGGVEDENLVIIHQSSVRIYKPEK